MQKKKTSKLFNVFLPNLFVLVIRKHQQNLIYNRVSSVQPGSNTARYGASYLILRAVNTFERL